jgi:cytochrome b involved in lipid metabolism
MKGNLVFSDMAAVKAHQAAHPSMYIVVYENKVLDIASFRDEHPGGPDVFEGYQGGVITEAFDDAGHTSAAKADMDDYLIGTLSASSAGAARGAAPSREEEIAKRRPSAFWTTWVPLIGAAVAGVAVFLVISARRQPATTSRR